MERPFRFAVAGTGDIAGFYLECFNSREDRENLDFAGAWNRTEERGRSFVAKHGGAFYRSLEELCEDGRVDAVVNLTSPLAHERITEACLRAGKHVLTEKPLALSAGKAGELISLAAEKGVTLSSAPFILLGHNQQRVGDLLREGRIGKPVSAAAEMFHGRVEAWHPNPEQFYTEGAGPLLDVGPYPVSLMVTWFGRVREVRGMFDIAMPERVSLSGKPFKVTVFDHGVALLRFESGVIGRIAFSYANSNTNYHGIEVQGTGGSISLSSMMDARGELKVSNKDSARWDHVEGDGGPKPGSGVDWAGGIFELAAAVRQHRQPANSAALALHTLEVLLAVEKAAGSGETVSL
ncbi:MAG: Gfo/Idh/MocA family oxidoreductase [Candidatus Glassbacteria bacterium]|nr:Gfo/Idh/MocA family oxidoreductase [Candidatus Glassbacteria bacterium]